MDKSLILFSNDKEIYASEGHWLHPLFEVEEFLAAHTYASDSLFLRDKIAGKAAAFLVVRLGIKRAHIVLVSKGALAVFARFGVDVTYDQCVDMIECRTEHLVSEHDEIENVWQMLRRRAGRVSGLDLDVSDLHLSIDGKPILSGVSFHLGKGDQMIVKGSNGAGKTTLLKALLGLIPISSGSVVIGGSELSKSAKNKNRIGYVSQEKNSGQFPILASEVVEIGLTDQSFSREETQHRIEIAMKRTGCWHLANRSFYELSGGEKQRVSMARCFCQQAQVLLLDEPTSFLDSASKNDLFNLLKSLSETEAPTIVMVSHDEDWIARFSWPVYELKNGQICLNS